MRNKKRLKYGSLSIALSAVVIALVILANAFFTSFVEKKELYTDLTKSQLYTISEPAKEYLKLIKAPITIKFAVPEDTIRQYYQLDLVYRTAKNFSLLTTADDPEDKIPDITVEYFDSYKHPAQFEEYKKLTDSWSSTNVVIESVYKNEDGTESAYPLVYSLTSFFSKSSSSGTYVGYNGERRFLLAFLQLAGIEQPVVAFTTGHGEPIGTSLTDENNEYADFMAMFEEFGFRIQYVDLSKPGEELDPDCRLVVILDPQRDFIGKDLAAIDGRSELDKIAEYVDNHGSLMAFVGPTGVDYRNLGDYLEEWGVSIKTTYAIRDEDNALGDSSTFSVKYTTEGLGASVQKNYRNLRTVFYKAAPVQIIFTEKENMSMNVTSSFRTSKNAVAYANDDDTLSPADLGNVNGFDLFVVSSKLKYENNEDYYSYVMACGSPGMLKYTSSQMFANRGILNLLITRIPLLKIPVDLDYKSFENYDLTTLTNNTAKVWGVVLKTVIPLVVLAAGAVVVVIRKKR